MRKEHCYLFLILLGFVLLGGCGVDWFPGTSTGTSNGSVIAFSFASKTGVVPGATVTSDPITVAFSNVSGVTSPTAAISVSGPNDSQFSVNGSAFTSQTQTVKKGDTVVLQHTAASGFAQTVTTTLTIGSQSATFTSITQASVAAFAFKSISSGQFGARVTSAPITVSVLVGSLPAISVSSPFDNISSQFSVNGGTFTSVPGTVNNGATVKVRQKPSDSVGTPVSTVLTIGNQSATFTTVLKFKSMGDLTGAGTEGSQVIAVPILQIVPGTYTIAVTGTGSFSADNGISSFIDQSTGPQQFTFTDTSNNNTVLFSDFAPAAGSTSKTTVTIDGVPAGTFTVTGQ